MSQTSIAKTGQPIAVAGQLSDSHKGTDTVSRFSGEASAVIPFGVGVKPGTTFRKVLLPTASSSIIEGIVRFGYGHVPGATGDLDQTLGGLKPNAGMDVVRRGRMYVLVDANVTTITPYSDRGYCRFESSSGATVVGAWRNTDDSHVVDCSKAVQFVSPLFTAADGSSKIAEVQVEFTIKP